MSSVHDGIVLVTGGAGFIGAALVQALVARGRRVRVFDNAFRGRPERLAPLMNQIEFINGDVRDREQVRTAMKSVSTVFHLAAINGTKHFYEIPDQVLSVGVLGTIHTLEAAREYGVAEYFYASSSEAYQTPPVVPTPETVPLTLPDSLNPRYSYGGSKLIGEILAFNYGRGKFKTVVFRPHNVYGPDMGYEHVIPAFVVRLRRAMEEREQAKPGQPSEAMAKTIDFPIQGSGEETRAFCHIDDFTAGLLVLADRGEDRNVYHIGTAEEVSIRDLARRIGQQSGVDLRIVHSEAPAGATPRRCPDIGKLAALGYAPRVSLDAGLARVLREFRMPSREELA